MCMGTFYTVSFDYLKMQASDANLKSPSGQKNVLLLFFSMVECFGLVWNDVCVEFDIGRLFSHSLLKDEKS